MRVCLRLRGIIPGFVLESFPSAKLGKGAFEATLFLFFS
jgi:hypothetical protein